MRRTCTATLAPTLLALGILGLLWLGGISLAPSGSAASSDAVRTAASAGAPGAAPATGALDSLQAPVALGAPRALDGYLDPSLAAPSAEVNATLSLTPSDAAGLSDYSDGEPSAPPLSPAEVQTDFGPSTSSLSALREYLTREGISVRAPADGFLWLVSGSAASFDRAFSTSLVTYQPGPDAATSTPVMAYATTPSLPAGLPVSSISAPSPVGNIRPLVVGPVNPTTGALEPATASPTPTAEGATLSCPNGSLTPARVENAYDVDPVYAGGDEGQGETIGIVDAYDPATNDTEIQKDLGEFSRCYGLPAENATIAWPVPGPSDLNATSSTGWGLETSLDTEWAHATAPDASIDLVMSPNEDYGLYYGVDWLVASRSVDVISLSWGEPESGIFNLGPCDYDCNATTDGTLATLGPILAAAADEGIDVFVAAGDCGANGGTFQFTPWYPASDPHAIGVGGTELNISASGEYESETAWDGTSSFCLNGGGTGGGFSVLPRPPWQSGPGFSRFTNTTRGSPDVALVSADPVGIFYDQAEEYVEGTSDAAPQWAGFGALLGEAREADGQGPYPGFLGPSLYQVLSSSRYTSDFHPVLTGWNGYSAGNGWDPLTGIGTPQVANLLHSLAQMSVQSTPPVSTPSLSAEPQAGISPLPVSFQVGAVPQSGGASRYTFYYGDIGAPYDEANATTQASNTSSFLYPAAAALNVTYPGGGAYTAYAAVENATDNTSDTVPVEINVGNAGPLQVEFGWTAAAAGAPVAFRATASGGTAPYHFAYYFGDGTSSDGWEEDQGTISHIFLQNGSYLVTVVANDSSAPLRGGSLTQCVVVGTGGTPCPTLTPTIVDDVVPVNPHLTAGATTLVRVTATFDGAPVAGAALTLSAATGSLSVTSGTTDAAGNLFTNYTAPLTNATEAFGIFANASAGGYRTGFGEAVLLVDPADGPSLTPWVRFGATPAVGGSTEAVLVGGWVAGRNAPAEDAAVSVSFSGAGSGTLSGLLDASGFFAGTWQTPAVSSPTAAVLTVSLALPGYTSVPVRVVLPLVPAGAEAAPVVSLSLSAPSVGSMGSVLATIDISNASTGAPLSVGVANLSLASEPLGTANDWRQTGPGSYEVLFSTAITPLYYGDLLVLNVSAGGGRANASAGALVEVLGSTGGLVLTLTPTSMAPNTTTNMTVTVSSAVYDVPLYRAYILVEPEFGDPSVKQGNPVFAWTDAQGNVTFAYTSPNYTIANWVIVEAVGWYYNYTAVNLTFEVENAPPPPHHSIPPINWTGPASGASEGVVIPAVGLCVAATVILTLEYRRQKQLQRPGGPGAEPPHAPPTPAASAAPPGSSPAPVPPTYGPPPSGGG